MWGKERGLNIKKMVLDIWVSAYVMGRGSRNLFEGKQELNGIEVSDYVYIYGISLLTKQEAKAYV